MSALPTHPSCEYDNGTECESCSELTEIEAQLEELCERHHQARMKRNYVHSPLIHQFPLEIVTSIFTLAFPPRDTCPWCSIVGGERDASPLVLTKVCHTWRALALSTPRLWSNIAVDVENPNLPLLNHQFAYSGVVPLSVYLFASGFGSKQGRASAKQVMSLVIQQLHNIASLYLNFTDNVAMACGFISGLDYPKTAPLLKEFHFHCLDDALSSSFQLRLAIEPPRPQQVILDCTFNQISLDWTNVSSLELVSSCIQMLPPTLESLKCLALRYNRNWDLPMAQTISRSIEHVIHEDTDPEQFMLTMTLPSLRTLAVDITYMETLSPITCNFLHRSLCPLQDLSINFTIGASNNDVNGERLIQALIDVLEITNTLQRLALRLVDELPSSSVEPLVRRFSPRDSGFLPCLQTFLLETPFLPPIDLLLDAMAPNDSLSGTPNGPNKERPLCTLHLELDVPLDEVGLIQQDVLVRILQMQAAGKKISITCTRAQWRPPVNLVEHWKSSPGFGEG